ncbi:MAG: GC-type dockerin domain-anchored protein [Phycisphaerales bacterium]|mgnify:CR=1 FL=1
MRRITMVASGTACLASAVLGDPVPIVNPGFETINRPLAGGEQSNGAGGAGVELGTYSTFPFGGGVVDWSNPVIVPGWQTRTVPFGSPSQILAGVLRPTDVGGDPFITGIEGDHVFAIQAALAGQDTGVLLRPNTEYTLGFLGGISRFDSEYFFSMSLIAIEDGVTLPLEGQAGVTRLELGRFFPPGGGADGLMRRYEFSWTSPETLPAPLVGTTVGIHLFGSDGLPRVLYDDFTLTAVSLDACPADVDGDGELTVFDFLAFQNLFDAGDARADLDGDGSLTLFDFLAFQDAFDAGCP